MGAKSRTTWHCLSLSRAGRECREPRKAIQHLEAALAVLARDTSPFQWAYAQNNLANAYLNPRPR